MRKLYFLIILLAFTLGLAAQSALTATLVKTSTVHCTGSPVSYSVNSAANITTYTWSVFPTKDLVSFSDLNTSTVSLTFSSTAHHTVYLNYTDNTGANGLAVTPLTVNQSPKSSFNASFNAPGFPTELILTNYSKNFNANFWSFSDSEGDSAVNTIKSYTTSGNYTVTLLSFSDKGCRDSATYDFVISNASSLTLPNIFTPNGDGANDTYKPISQNLSSLKAWVYNRYGVLVMSWNTVNGFWDGYTISGEECSEAVYFIVVEATGFDGKDYKLNTNITLAR